MKVHYPLDPVTGIENAALPWSNGNPATGTNGSYPPFGLFIDPQAEIVKAQRSSGLTDSADGSDTAQLAQAISIGTNLGNISQPLNVNDLVVALPGSVTWPLLKVGMTFGGFISAPNNGAMTVTMTGFGELPGKLNLVDGVGNALVGNALPANVPFKFQYDGTQFRLTGAIGNVGAAISASPFNGLILPLSSNSIPSASSAVTQLTTFGTPANNVPSLLTWNSGAATVTVNATRYYYLQIYLDTNFSAGAYTSVLTMNKNGSNTSSVFATCASVSGSYGPAFSASRELQLTAGDVLRFYCGQNSGSTQTAPVSILIEAKGQ